MQALVQLNDANPGRKINPPKDPKMQFNDISQSSKQYSDLEKIKTIHNKTSTKTIIFLKTPNYTPAQVMYTQIQTTY